MFEKLFTKPAVLSRHKNAPYAEERERFLSYCEEEGYTRATLLLMARELLWVARKLMLCPGSKVTPSSLRQLPNGGHRENTAVVRRSTLDGPAFVLFKWRDRGFAFWVAGIFLKNRHRSPIWSKSLVRGWRKNEVYLSLRFRVNVVT